MSNQFKHLFLYTCITKTSPCTQHISVTILDQKHQYLEKFG